MKYVWENSFQRGSLDRIDLPCFLCIILSFHNHRSSCVCSSFYQSVEIFTYLYYQAPILFTFKAVVDYWSSSVVVASYNLVLEFS